MNMILVHFLCCAFMTGLIWVIQILHYPAFAFVRVEEFKKFHIFHSRRITYLVGPIMLIELLTAVLLMINFLDVKILWGNLFLLILIWGITFFVSVPLHERLGEAQDVKVISRLVVTNWYRTILWSLRLILLLYFLIQYAKPDCFGAF